MSDSNAAAKISLQRLLNFMQVKIEALIVQLDKNTEFTHQDSVDYYNEYPPFMVVYKDGSVDMKAGEDEGEYCGWKDMEALKKEMDLKM